MRDGPAAPQHRQQSELLRRELIRREGENADLRRELARCGHGNKELETDYLKLQQREQELQQQLDAEREGAMQQRLKAKTFDNDATQRLLVLQRKNEQLKTSFNDKASRLQQQLDAKQVAIMDERRRFSELKNKHDKLGNDYQQLQEDAVQERLKTTTLDKDAVGRVKKLHCENEQLKTKASRLQQQLDAEQVTMRPLTEASLRATARMGPSRATPETDAASLSDTSEATLERYMGKAASLRRQPGTDGDTRKKLNNIVHVRDPNSRNNNEFVDSETGEPKKEDIRVELLKQNNIWRGAETRARHEPEVRGEDHVARALAAHSRQAGIS